MARSRRWLGDLLFLRQSDVTAPSEATPAALQIFFAEGVETANVDLSTADPEKVKVLCGEFENGEGATGVLNLTKTAKAAGLTVSLDARSGGSRLRIAYAGAFVSGYESDNRLKVTVADTPEEADVKRVFRHKESLTNNFAFGLADAELPADLMTGNYAVQLGLSDLNIGKTIDLATEGSKCTLALYDYATYTTYDIAKIEGVTGSVTTFGTAERLYLRLSAVFPEGPAIECEWFGDATSVEEAFDLTPVRPFVPHVTVYSKEGDVLQTYDLASAEMRMEKNFRLRGGDPAYGGATFDAYFFYFRPVGFSGDIDEQYAKYEYPLLMIPVSYLPSTELKLYEPKDDLHWNFMYVKNENTLQYASGGYSETYSMYGMTSGYCPDDAVLTVVRNEDKSWKIVYTMTDSGSKDVYGTPRPWGYGNKAVLEWEGPIVKYSGTKKNDLTDADY